jgi:hypothetical protein
MHWCGREVRGAENQGWDSVEEVGISVFSETDIFHRAGEILSRFFCVGILECGRITPGDYSNRGS